MCCEEFLYRVGVEFHGHCNFSTYWEFELESNYKFRLKGRECFGTLAEILFSAANLLKVMILSFHYASLAAGWWCRHKRKELDEEPSALLIFQTFAHLCFPLAHYHHPFFIKQGIRRFEWLVNILAIYWHYWPRYWTGLWLKINVASNPKTCPRAAAPPLHHQDWPPRPFTFLSRFRPTDQFFFDFIQSLISCRWTKFDGMQDISESGVRKLFWTLVLCKCVLLSEHLI